MRQALFILIFLFLSSCEKEDTPSSGEPNETPTETRLMNDSLKAYFQFNIGSRWIYQRTDTVPPIYDTAWVVNSTQELVFTRFAPYEWERVAVNIEHSYYPSPPNSVSPYLTALMANSNGLTDVISISTNGNLFSAYTYFLSYPIDSISILEKSRGSGAVSFLERRYDTIINTVNINDILVINRRSSVLSERIHIAPKYGIIKFQNSNDNTEWILKEFNLQ